MSKLPFIERAIHARLAWEDRQIANRITGKEVEVGGFYQDPETARDVRLVKRWGKMLPHVRDLLCVNASEPLREPIRADPSVWRDAQQPSQSPTNGEVAANGSDGLPLECTLAELCRAYVKNEHYSKYPQKLKDKRVLTEFERPKSLKGLWKFWFADSEERERIEKLVQNDRQSS